MFQESEVVYQYTTKQAIEDGVLFDCMNRWKHPGTLIGKLTRQHFKWPVVMTVGICALIDELVNDKRNCNDWRGVWHDVCSMLKFALKRRPDLTADMDFPVYVPFKLEITTEGKHKLYTFTAVFNLNEDAKPYITIMLPEED